MPDDETSLVETLRQVASAKKRDDLNQALNDLAILIYPLLKPMAVSLFQRLKRDYGTEPLENDEDILSELLWKLTKSAQQFKGATEAEAESFLKTALDRKFKDVAKKAERRARFWRKAKDWFGRNKDNE